MHRHYRLPLASGSIFKRHEGYAFRVDAGLDPVTGKRKQVLRKALSDAERLNLIVHTPAAVAKPPVAERLEHETWTSRWRDLDLDGGGLRIVQTLTTVNWKPVFSTPKTKRSRRIVYLDPDTVRVLRAHRKKQRVDMLAGGPAWDREPDLVFCDELGGLLHPEEVTRWFGAKIRELGLPPVRLHDLRHTYATLTLKSGIHPKIVSERLGHATIAVTLDLYSHVAPALGRQAAGVVAGRLFPNAASE